MKAQQLQGIVERLTYESEDGYTVLRLQVSGRADLATVVGHLPDVRPGESLRLTGTWVSHERYGRQFKAERCEQMLPSTYKGIERYLGSGLIKGIGPVTASRIVQRFKLDTLRVLDEEPRKLHEVPGVGAKRAAMIADAWEEQKAIKDVMIFLQSHGVTTGLAVKIYKTYGDQALNVVQNDPYRLTYDIWGVGFKTADKLARDLGLPPDSPGRVQAGVAYTLGQLSNEGHVYAVEENLVAETSKLLAVAPELAHQAVAALEAEEQVKRETLIYPTAEEEQAKALHADPPILPIRVQEERAVYLTPFYYGEVGASNRLRDMIESPTTLLYRFRQVRDWESFLDGLTRGDGIVLSEQQRQAVKMALTNKVTVLTGGPGTGKTVSVRTVIAALENMGCRYALAAPTGRAAKRLSEAAGRPAKTVHRMLGYVPFQGFKFNDDNRLPVDALIVDEASMLDLLLTNNLLKALDPAAHLLLVGDVDQLPSVGAGDVLRDVIASGRAAVVRLETIFRQAEGSHIIRNGHRINRGQFPVVNEGDDFFLFTQAEPKGAADMVVDVVKNRIPHKFGLHALDDVQVLCPMHRGTVGVTNLNQRLQAALNPPAPDKTERQLGGRLLRVGDKLMQIRNNYDKDVFNGDIGRLVALDLENQTFSVKIDGRPVRYDWSEVDELAHAYAISTHKSQGSEFPAIVMPVMTQHYLMLQRNLLYTAVTRARRLVVLVGQRRAIGIAVSNNRVAERHSGLSVRLAR